MPARGGPQHIPRPDRWRPVDPPDWIDGGARPSVAEVETALRGIEPSLISRGPAVDRPPRPRPRSAVLVSVYDDAAHGATTLLTRRPLHMRTHAGEVAFPGGAVDDDDDSVWHTALREAHEEISLDPRTARRIGELDRFVTGASFSLVTPVVAALEGQPSLTPSAEEVDAILHGPLGELLEPEVYRQEIWLWQGEERAMHFFELDGDTVWGATALMLHRLLEIVVTGR